ncbi:hypothetical protein GQ43DRAFT_345223, partial [Delitschia confertaspora ATCC 74209]
MNNFSSFLDAASTPQFQGSNMPRQAPTPSASAAAAHQQPVNGIVGPGATSSIPMVNGLASGGQQTDMNHLWSVVQQLSQVLEENRAQAAGIVNGVQAIQARAAEEGGIGGLSLREVNGELSAASRTSEIAHLTTRLHTAESTITALQTSTTSLQTLVSDYESALTLVLDKLRPYAYTQTQAMLALHKHYQSALESERATSMQLRIEQAGWQAGFGRVAEYARQALKARSEEEMPYLRELKELKEENRVLRRLAGWEEREDSSDEE